MSKNTMGYDVWSTLNDKWDVTPDSLEWNTKTSLKPGSMSKLGFTIVKVSNNEFELSYILHRDPIFETLPTVEAAMNRADEIEKEVRG